MANWKEELVALIKAVEGLEALVGDRVSFGYSRQGDPLPRVTFFCPFTATGNTLDDGPDGLPQKDVQIDCVAATGAEAEEIARRIRRRHREGGVAGFRGLTQGGLFVQSLLFEDDGRDQVTPAQDGDGRAIHLVTMDLKLSYEEF